MRAAANWRNYKRLFKKSFPDGPEQLEMEFMEVIPISKSKTQMYTTLKNHKNDFIWIPIASSENLNTAL